MKLTREQVDEIMKNLPDTPQLDTYYKFVDKTREYLESFIEKEYKCPCCGGIDKHIHPCEYLGSDYSFSARKGWACYQDDWNGGIKPKDQLGGMVPEDMEI